MTPHDAGRAPAPLGVRMLLGPSGACSRARTAARAGCPRSSRRSQDAERAHLRVYVQFTLNKYGAPQAAQTKAEAELFCVRGEREDWDIAEFHSKLDAATAREASARWELDVRPRGQAALHAGIPLVFFRVVRG